MMGFSLRTFLLVQLLACAVFISYAAEAQTNKVSKKEVAAAKKAVNKNAAKPTPKDLWLGLKLSDNSPYEIESAPTPANGIDKIVEDLQRANFVKPAKFASDAVFIRRVCVDLTGTLPSLNDVKTFLEDSRQDKRERLVDKLISSKEFTDYWTLKFADMLRIKAEFPINLWPNAAQAYNRFINRCISKNTPYDEMVRRMLTSSGSNFRVGEVNFYRAMQSRDPASMASCVALSFMGMRFDKLPQTQRENMSAFFSRLLLKSTKEWKEEIVVNDISKRSAFKGTLPDGWQVDVNADADPREIFAQWLTARRNPYFSRAFANRAWTWIFGTAIVSPADEMFADNAPVSPQLLDYLADYFENSGYDIQKLFKHIVMSRTYAQSFIPQGDPKKSLHFFAVYPVHRFDAEVIIDALCRISGTTEIYSSTTPEPYTTLPDYERAISLPDGSITTTFLELFGKPARDTGAVAERSNTPSSSQKLYMVNSSHIRSKLVRSKQLHEIYRRPAHEAFYNLYLTILSRPPTLSEMEAYRAKRTDWNRVNDLAWALVNSEEFINRH